MTYDEKSFELAEHFLPTKAPWSVKDALAQAIQQRIEEFLKYEADNVNDPRSGPS